MPVVAEQAIWRANGAGHRGLAQLVMAVMVMLVVVVVMCGRLAKEGLHASMAAAVEHNDFDDLLALDERLGPQVGHTHGGLVLQLNGEMVGGGARCRMQLKVLRWRHRPLC